MRIPPVSWVVLCFVLMLAALVAPAPSSAQDLLVARAESLNAVFDDVEPIAHAVGKDLSREMLLMMASSFLGSDATGYIDMDRPVVAVMPVEGMMMTQKGVVVAVPVTDAAAAIDALASLFQNHTVEGEMHAFSENHGAALYLTAANGYLRVGGDADLVARNDPLTAAPTGSTTSVELFLEPIAPMIAANLTMVKAQMMTSLEAEAADDEEMPYDPAAMEPILDAYFDGFRWLLANTSSIRLRLDVDEGYVRFAEDLIPKADGALAGFIEVQKGGLPEIAKLADEKAAWYMAGQVKLTEEHRQGLKSFVASYLELMGKMTASRPGNADKDAADSASDTAIAESMTFWNEYMAMLSPYADRWIDCLQGDMVASFGFPEGRSFAFAEAFGMVNDDECISLVSEMSDELVRYLRSAEELSDVFTVAEGPEIGDSTSVLMTLDMVKILDEMGQTSDERAKDMMQAMYGEKMSFAMVTSGDVVLATGGMNAVAELHELAAMVHAPKKPPSFAPLDVRSGLMMSLNLGAMLTWMKNAIPEDAAEIERVAKRLSGDIGRVPMAVAFDSHMATFDTAISLETLEVIAAIVEEERAKAAEEQTVTAEGDLEDPRTGR